MVELVAENYHNIWAKKKKIDLNSKGMQKKSIQKEKYLKRNSSSRQQRAI
jgi:hypothetical protein